EEMFGFGVRRRRQLQGVLFEPVEGRVLFSAVGTQLAVAQQPTQTEVDNYISPAITVDIQDIDSNLVSGDGSSVSVAIGSGPNGGILSGDLTVNTVGGMARFNNLSVNVAGTYTLSFTDGGMTGTSSIPFNVVPSPLDGSHLVFTLPPSGTVVAGSKLPKFVVTAEQPNDAASTSTRGNVTLSIVSGPANGKIIGHATASLKHGTAVFNNVRFDVAGTYTLAATNEASVAAALQAVQVTAAAAKKMVFVQQPTGQLTTTSTFSVSVELTDKYGNLATTDGANIVLVLAGGKGVDLQGNTAGRAVDAIAEFDDLSVLTAGNYVIKAVDVADRLQAKSVRFRIK
ncbi:MAG TPA: hypothetical protein VG722_08285, partial [Tepidisphaeraceae bacterium]|nr:hypothetical protein [Tepidisphaeraceae bacterium]